MRAPKASAPGHLSCDSNLIRALEILPESAGDVPMATRCETACHPDTLESAACEPAGDIPLAPGTVTLLLRFSHSAELDQEISFHLYRRRVVSERHDGATKEADLAAIDHKFVALRPSLQAPR